MVLLHIQTFGFTAVPLSDAVTKPVVGYPWPLRLFDIGNRGDYWVWNKSTVRHGGIQDTTWPVDISPQSLVPSKKVGMAVYPNGELHFFIDGQIVPHRKVSGLPVHSALHGMVVLDKFDSPTTMLGSFQLGKHASA